MNFNDIQELNYKLNCCLGKSDPYNIINWAFSQKNGLALVGGNFTKFQIFRLYSFQFLNHKQFYPTQHYLDPANCILPFGWNTETDEQRYLYHSSVYNFYSQVSIARSMPVAVGNETVKVYTFRMLLGTEEISRTFKESDIPDLILDHESKPSNMDWVLTGRIFDGLAATYVKLWEEFSSTGSIKKNSSCSTPKEKIINFNGTFAESSATSSERSSPRTESS